LLNAWKGKDAMARTARLQPVTKLAPPASLENFFPKVATEKTRQVLMDRLVLCFVIALTVVLAAVAYQEFLNTARFRWASAIHDRNAHYYFGLSLALDVQQADVKQLLSDFDGARTWPPLHGTLVALVLLVGGLHYQLAVLPSLAGWVAMVVFGFLTARRLVPRGGNLAGLAAVVFLLASPAHRVFATDIMLESLGAGLSLVALYLYLLAVQRSSVWAWRGLGLVLTALFLHKYNYWLLVVLALLAAEFSDHPHAWWHWLRQTIIEIDWRRWFRAQWRQPLNYVLAVLIGLLIALVLGGGQTMSVVKQAVSFRSPHNLLTVVYAILFLRAALWWRREGHVWSERLSSGQRQLAFWHGLPIALWLLLPKRLGYWLWYIAANKGDRPQDDPLGGISFYASHLVADYHLGLWSAVLAAALFLVAALAWRRLRPGGRAVLFLALLATVLTVPHPNRKSRFLHSWIAAGWVGAGAGLALLAQHLTATRLLRARPLLTAAAVGGLGVAHAPGLLQAGCSPERGHHDYLNVAASTCDLTDYYLPKLSRSRHTVVFSTLEMKYLIRWSFLERYRQRDRIGVDLKGLGSSAAEDQRCFEQWLASTSCDTVVFVDVPPGSYFYELTCRDEAFAMRLRDWLANQTVFVPTERRTFMRYGSAVTLYARNATPAGLPPLASSSPYGIRASR
jgi:hypothetical protein